MKSCEVLSRLVWCARARLHNYCLLKRLGLVAGWCNSLFHVGSIVHEIGHALSEQPPPSPCLHVVNLGPCRVSLSLHFYFSPFLCRFDVRTQNDVPKMTTVTRISSSQPSALLICERKSKLQKCRQLQGRRAPGFLTLATVNNCQHC